jgi:hypothetical protein
MVPGILDQSGCESDALSALLHGQESFRASVLFVAGNVSKKVIVDNFVFEIIKEGGIHFAGENGLLGAALFLSCGNAK